VAEILNTHRRKDKYIQGTGKLFNLQGDLRRVPKIMFTDGAKREK
jgi:hypothetical protein